VRRGRWTDLTEEDLEYVLNQVDQVKSETSHTQVSPETFQDNEDTFQTGLPNVCFLSVSPSQLVFLETEYFTPRFGFKFNVSLKTAVCNSLEPEELTQIQPLLVSSNLV